MLLDTCALLWLFGGGDLGPPAVEAIEEAVGRGTLTISAVSAIEIAQATGPFRRSPLRLSLPPREWFAAALAAPGVRFSALTPEIAFAAYGLPGEFHRDPSDRMLIATARELGVPIVTRDRAILAYADAGHVRAVAC